MDNNINTSTYGDWPIGLLVDEVWLKIRRISIHKLEEEGLWQKTTEYKNFAERQKKLGEKIRSGTLREVFGDNDYAYLNSELIFGSANRQVRSKLSYILAFGYNIGWIIYSVLDDKEGKYTEEISMISSVFNLGISIFDYIYDTEPELFDKFNRIVNYSTLHKISTDGNACKSLQLDCDNIDSIELCLLSKIIIWFFLKLQSFYIGNGGRKDIWKRLNNCILLAYLAETHSSDKTKYSKKILDICRKKSTLPFLVIYHIALLTSTSNPSPIIDRESKVDNYAYTISKTIGEIFWRTDDLTDLLKDLESGNLNSILIKVNKKHGYTEQSQLNYKILMELINGNYIKEIANQICSQIKFVLNSLESIKSDEQYVNMTRNLIMFHVRNWME